MKTHIVKLREGKAPAEEVTDAQLADMRKVFGSRMSEYDVTPIVQAEKPAKVVTEKDKDKS